MAEIPKQEDIDPELLALYDETYLYHGYGVPYGENGESTWPLPDGVSVGDVIVVETDNFEQPRGPVR
ncbi:MAG TPA: hypothetical protein VFT53_00525 [Candidatus Saccharimonadales bacterium]|nr:hypothetical protein [Candidatus Saccharimonadales bacterium]